MDSKSDIIKNGNKFVLVFPGQGSQYELMGSDFLNAHNKYLEYFEISSEIIGRDLLAIINNKDGRTTGLLDQTQFCQIAIYSLSCALNDYLINSLNFSKSNIGAVIGHSLGDYGALYSSGAFDYGQGASIVAYRGKMMGSIGRELEERTGKEMMMSAVLGAEISAVENVLEKYKDSVFLANYNDYSQVVISGIKEDVVKAGEDLKSAGAKRVIELKVNIASHCPLMREASKKLTEYFEANSIVFGKSEIDFFSSTEVAYAKENEVKDALVRQLINPVKWVESIENLLNSGFRRFIEVGPGKVLSGLIKRIASKLGYEGVIILNTDSLYDLENLKNNKN
ncbi:MAG: ACP S-malonyltransferase [Actinobacteria bacterium]|nr:ACP S-malonyltransferase [Actinomycetota bacterium]